MRGNWCKTCNKFVEIKKAYIRGVIIFCLIILIALVIGFVIWYPWGGLIALASSCVCTGGHILDLLKGRDACIICGKTTVWKKVGIVEEKDDYKNLDWLGHQWHDLGKSTQDIADEQGVSMITIRKWLDKCEKR